MPGGTVTVRDLWENRQTYNLVPLEEGYLKHWSFGRYACLGDSVHKMTPNMGAGGNSAIEGAAALANEINSLLRRRHAPMSTTSNDIEKALENYQHTRSVRASATFRAANFVTRLHAVRGLVEYFLAHYIMPNAGDLMVDLASDSWIGSVRLDYLPVPLRSLGGTMPFNPEQGMGKNENLLVRAVLGLPLLAIACYGLSLPRSHGSDDSESLTFVFSFGTIYGITLVESARRANLLTPMQMPLLFGLGALNISVDVVLPLYFYVYHTLVPISRFRALDLRLTELSYTRSILPLVVALWYAPAIGMRLQLSKVGEWPGWALKLSPLWISAAQWLVRRIALLPTIIQQDRIHNVSRDLPALRLTAKALAVGSAAMWIATTLPSFVSSPSAAMAALGPRRYSGLLFHASSLLWVGYLFRDLKIAGMIRQSWISLLSKLAISAVSLGPGATVALAWVWREEVLATKRHWGAIVTADEIGQDDS